MTETSYHGQTIFLTGPPMSGKTTTALLWSLQRPRPTVVLDWDQIRGILLTGDQLRKRPITDVTYTFAARSPRLRQPSSLLQEMIA